MFLILTFAAGSFALQHYFGWSAVGVLYGTIFGWQLLADQLKWTLVKPSVVMLKVAQISNDLAAWSGQQFARLSSFLAIIEWNILLTTITHLGCPNSNVLLGRYGKQTLEYTGKHGKDLLVYIGSVILLIVGCVHAWPSACEYLIQQCKHYQPQQCEHISSYEWCPSY
jgi:hypothetical protein